MPLPEIPDQPSPEEVEKSDAAIDALVTQIVTSGDEDAAKILIDMP